MKYRVPHWGNLIKKELKDRKISQRYMARRVGSNENAFYKKLGRKEWAPESIRQISQVLEKDLMIRLLSDETKAILKEAREAGIDGRSKQGDNTQEANPQSTTGLEHSRPSRAELEQELKEQTQARIELELKNARLGEQMAQLEVEYLKKLVAKEKELRQLEEECRKLGQQKES